jgi:hypothetical protein
VAALRVLHQKRQEGMMTEQEKLGQALINTHKANKELTLSQVHDLLITTASVLNANGNGKS